MGDKEEGECFPINADFAICHVLNDRPFKIDCIITVTLGKKKQLVKYGHKWNTQLVIAYEHSVKINKILAKSGHPAGALGYIKFYQKALDKVIKRMTLKQKEEASATAKEWNDTHPPAEIQAKYTYYPMIALYSHTSRATEEKGRKYVQEFAKEMWKQCGARVVVMVAWKGAIGDVMYGL